MVDGEGQIMMDVRDIWRPPVSTDMHVRGIAPTVRVLFSSRCSEQRYWDRFVVRKVLAGRDWSTDGMFWQQWRILWSLLVQEIDFEEGCVIRSAFGSHGGYQ